MNTGRLIARLSILTFLVALTAALTPRAVEACAPGQVCPPAPVPGLDKKRKNATATPVPTAKPTTSAGVALLPIPPGSGSDVGGGSNVGNPGGLGGANPGPINANPGGKDPGPSQNPLLNSPLSLIGIIVVLIVGCFGGGFLFLRNRRGLGSIGGAGSPNSLGNENGTIGGGTENFTTTFKDVTDKWEKALPAVQNPGGSENLTITHPDLGGGIEMNTIGGHDIGGAGGEL